MVTTLNELYYHRTFNKIQEKFNNVLEHEYENYLCKDDQVLRNIAMYLLENYKGQFYGICTHLSDCNERCKHLNTWLNEKRAIYTSNDKCTRNKELWDKYIEKLWVKLQQDLGSGIECNRSPLTQKKFPDNWIIPSCNNTIPVEVTRSCPEPPPPKDVVCPVSTTPTSSSCKAVLTTTYFSSVGMKINNLIRGKTIKRRISNKEYNESFGSDDNSNVESLDRRFNVIYNSFQN
ncbi:PIR Superfamily Protein [Plasmodium ovale curtisi]|uniref:PIR Superfamily Protein n=1 Tax=Plasmodium ovale curtisi TaxID=864141 RepID=A0A1A8VQ16_PLAOA|nr:PIR Superfamily Protein [Plasmodium ovale curtisi]